MKKKDKIALAIIGFGVLASVGVLLSTESFSQKKQNSLAGAMSGFPCHQMGGVWMGQCTFDENGDPILDEIDNFNRGGDTFASQDANLPDVIPSQIVVLADGDTYEMTAGLVKQEVGNRVIKRLAYNGMIPGPLLQVEKGARITLVLTNDLDVPTTLHSHGLRGQDRFDGVPTSMGGKQVAMQPGDTFRYELEFPDTGVFWYHPHIREDYGQELGLFGNFQVTEQGYWNSVDREEFWVLDDFALGEPFYTEGAVKTLMGRFGQILTINNSEEYNVTVARGEVARFYMTNVANTRTFDIAIDGVPMKLVGGDIGRIERESFVDDIIIAPSERWIFETQFSDVGIFPIEHRGQKIGTVTVVDDTPLTAGAVPSTYGQLRSNDADYAIVRDSFSEFLAAAPDKKLTIDIDLEGMMGNMGGMMQSGHGDEAPHGDEGIEWEDDMEMMNQRTDEDNVTWILRDEETGAENEDINWSFDRDALVKIEIFNDPESVHPMQHPIHFHGQRFAVITRNGEPVDRLQWEDTALIRSGEKIEIILNTTNVGTWMAHCHIAEHLSSGMMFNFTVK